MKDVRPVVKKLYYNLLAANGITMYDRVVPIGATAPYVIYSVLTNGVANPNNSHYQHTVTVLLDVVMIYMDGFGGTTDVQVIAATIKAAVLPGRPCDPKPFSNAAFNFIVSTHLSDTDMDNQSTTGRVVRTLSRFQHIVEET